MKFEIIQIVSSSEDEKFSNVRGLYLRKYGIQNKVQKMRKIWGKENGGSFGLGKKV